MSNTIFPIGKLCTGVETGAKRRPFLTQSIEKTEEAAHTFKSDMKRAQKYSETVLFITIADPIDIIVKYNTGQCKNVLKQKASRKV